MNQKKNIIIFSTAYHPFIGGAELAVREITDRIHEYQFFLITARMDARLPKTEHIGNTLVYRVGMGIPLLDKVLSPVRAAFEARRIMKKYQINAYWSIMASYISMAPILLTWFRLDKNIPLLLTLQEGDSAEHIARARLGGIAWVWRRMVHRANHVQVISTHLSKLARKYGYKGDITIIPNGVDGKKFTGKKKNGKRKTLSGSLPS